jgi:hypothetical protein
VMKVRRLTGSSDQRPHITTSLRERIAGASQQRNREGVEQRPAASNANALTALNYTFNKPPTGCICSKRDPAPWTRNARSQIR